MAQIARIAKLPQKDVLEEINLNRSMVTVDAKGKIVKLSTHNVIINMMAEQYKQKRLYSVNEINYGADKEIRFHNAEQDYPQLYQVYYCGGLGDSYASKIILYNEHNLSFVHGLGMKEWGEAYKEYAAKGIEHYWKPYIQ